MVLRFATRITMDSEERHCLKVQVRSLDLGSNPPAQDLNCGMLLKGLILIVPLPEFISLKSGA